MRLSYKTFLSFIITLFIVSCTYEGVGNDSSSPGSGGEIDDVKSSGTAYIAIYNGSKSFEKDNGKKSADKQMYIKSIVEKVNIQTLPFYRHNSKQ